MTHLKVSVVIPAYNEEKYLSATLESLINQTVTPYEILVVDNNSTDKTVEIAKEYPVKVISEKRQGLSFARNKGFNEAKGDIILRTDADTVAPRDWVERVANAFEKDEHLNTFSGSAVLYHPVFNVFFDFLCFYINDIFGYNSLLGPNFAIRKSVWVAVRGKTCDDDRRFHEDLDMAIHTQQLGGYKRDLALRVLTSNRRTSGIKGLVSMYTYFHVKWRKTICTKRHRKLSRYKWMKIW